MKKKYKKHTILLMATAFLFCMLGCGDTATQTQKENAISEETVTEPKEETAETSAVSEEASVSEETSVEETTLEESVVEESAVEESPAEESPAEESEAEESVAEAETPSESVEESKEEPSLPTYTVEAIDKTLYVLQNVSTRVGPSKEYDKTGSLKASAEVHATGKASTGWYQLENGAFVTNSKKYISEEKPVAKAPETPAPAPEAPASTPVVETPTPAPETPAPAPAPETPKGTECAVSPDGNHLSVVIGNTGDIKHPCYICAYCGAPLSCQHESEYYSEITYNEDGTESYTDYFCVQCGYLYTGIYDVDSSGLGHEKGTYVK